MNNLTEAESDTADAYDAMAENWTKAQTKVLFWEDEIRQFHDLLPSGRILEIGAGGGRDAKEFIALGYDYVGTDISANMLRVARRVNPGAIFEQASLYNRLLLPLTL
jgi:SAM-dependent methyltransferase